MSGSKSSVDLWAQVAFGPKLRPSAKKTASNLAASAAFAVATRVLSWLAGPFRTPGSRHAPPARTLPKASR
ncbi:Uncharacterised protein [Mycobacteroides abscessus subsp. abscessus]|nr:Uncharacterised protein [Mycobacteroides abscessus subsp. abscessus]SHV27799.1 Uncharacterised protein [Mycobacteroides abscessus subsp. abscessus]SIN55642.1 Uncharacterised protein [Mycobacteroides abscessus subsp. abscessus]SKU93455.1 Uncharacterised protein [Mycobacteroides abscessus subsp. abscessus]